MKTEVGWGIRNCHQTVLELDRAWLIAKPKETKIPNQQSETDKE
jgi:hypothetical protein